MDSESGHSRGQLINTPDHGKVLSFTGELPHEQAKPALEPEVVPSQDKPRQKKRAGRRVGMGRRHFLGLTAGTLVGVPVGLELAKYIPSASSLPPHEIPTVSHAAELAVVSDATPTEKVQSMQHAEHTPLLKMVALGIKENKLGDILPRLRKYYEQYKSENSLIAKATSIQGEIQQALQDPRLAPLQLSDQDKALFSAILLPTAAKESSFNPGAENGAQNEENKAIGLLQVKNSAAKEAAKRLGIQNYDLKNAKDNIVLATAILKRNMNLFPNLGMALAAYNLGEGKVGRAIQVHAKQDLKIPEEKVDHDFETMGLDGKSPPASTHYTKEYSVTWHDLVQSPNVVKDFKNQNYNEYELDYYDQIVAWAMVLKPDQFQSFTQLMMENTQRPQEGLWARVRGLVRR